MNRNPYARIEQAIIELNDEYVECICEGWFIPRKGFVMNAAFQMMQSGKIESAGLKTVSPASAALRHNCLVFRNR